MPNALAKIFKVFTRSPVDVAEADPVSRSANSGISEVWLYPDSEELSKQTALEARKIDQPVFRIGRRVSDSIAYPDHKPPDLLMFENSPFTLSRLQCQIEIERDKVVLRDMGSRLGTRLGDKRLRSNFRESSSLVVPKGSHSLILGDRDGPFRFRLVVT